MKKRILAAVLALCLILPLVGCGSSKAPLTAEDFAKRMEDAGYTVTVTPSSEYHWRDTSPEWDYKDYIDTVVEAETSPAWECHCVFYVWNDEAKAAKYYERRYTLISRASEDLESNTLTVLENSDDYFKYIVDVENERYTAFSINTRLGNTTMHASGYDEYRSDFENALEGTAY